MTKKALYLIICINGERTHESNGIITFTIIAAAIESSFRVMLQDMPRSEFQEC